MKNKITAKWTKEARKQVKTMAIAFTVELSNKSVRVAKVLKHSKIEVADVDEAMRWMINDVIKATEQEKPKKGLIKVVH